MGTESYPAGQIEGHDNGGALYGATPPQAWRRFVTRYVVFSGRASRSEFWWWMLAFVVVSIVLSFVNKAVVGPAPTDPDQVLHYTLQTSVLTTIWSLINFVGAASLTVRRLHDIGRSGWWWFIQLVPVIGSIVMIIFVLLPPRQPITTSPSGPDRR
ncbi:hypothetical protein GCM10011575_22170 [Microlunatus endophyticus]|uniref:DUF805 domain-containing protein n=1 Tax=Microlunatus endophyticus TaxID=1716077 RepID=A0A917W389_9ACTN|nr:DUF805 domain-containing protein [Microlunatus endophyticus]GGL63261.1 hypothetical protein GCM10011575_22170 [Microlunatus endophyticus]